MSIPSAIDFVPPLTAKAIGSKKASPKTVSSLEDTNADKVALTISATFVTPFTLYKYGFFRFITFSMSRLSIDAMTRS